MTYHTYIWKHAGWHRSVLNMTHFQLFAWFIQTLLVRKMGKNSKLLIWHTFAPKDNFQWSSWVLLMSQYQIFRGTLRADAHFASKNTLLKRNTLHCYILLKRTVCFKLACYSLLFNTLYPSTHFASCNVFLLSTVCFSTPFASHNTLLLNTLCFSAHSAPQNTLLLSTLCSLVFIWP